MKKCDSQLHTDIIPRKKRDLRFINTNKKNNKESNFQREKHWKIKEQYNQ